MSDIMCMIYKEHSRLKYNCCYLMNCMPSQYSATMSIGKDLTQLCDKQ